MKKVLKKLVPAMILLAILGSAIGGYCIRPWVDLRFVDYPVVQNAALWGVNTYADVAEMLADYPAHRDYIDWVTLEYGGIATKIADAKLLQEIESDWRYEVVEDLESEYPFIRVINVAEEEGVCGTEIYPDASYLRSLDSSERVSTLVKAIAKAVLLLNEHSPESDVLNVTLVKILETKCLAAKCVRAVVNLSMTVPADAFVTWANLSEDELYEGLVVLDEVEGAKIYADNPWTSWIFIEDELPRTSDDLAPWDYPGFVGNE